MPLVSRDTLSSAWQRRDMSLWRRLGHAQATLCLKNLVPNKSNSMYTSKRNGWNVVPSEQRGSLSSPLSSNVFFHVNESHLHKHSLLHPHPHMVLGLKKGRLYLTVEIERREQAACSLLISAQFCSFSHGGHNLEYAPEEGGVCYPVGQQQRWRLTHCVFGVRGVCCHCLL